MKVVFLNAGFDTRFETAESMLDFYQSVPNLAAALIEQGHAVVVLQAFHRNETLQHGGVEFELIETASGKNKDWAEIQRFADIAGRLAAHKPDVVHHFGVTMLSLHKRLAEWCGRHRSALTISFHGGHPRSSWIGRWLQRRALRHTRAFFFSNAVVSGQWQDAGVIPSGAKVVLAVEVSSPFAGMPKEEARQSLDLDGDPLFVWSGRLHTDKDPMTTLRGMQRIYRVWPSMRLAMATPSDEMIDDVRDFLASDSEFGERVALMGKVEHSKMEMLFSAADFFVHSSRREWGSNSLVEALSCGAIPVVAGIPSLRAMTEHIECAIVFEVGSADDLANQVLRVNRDQLGLLARSVKSSFDEHLSYRALAACYGETFRSLADTPELRR